MKKRILSVVLSAAMAITGIGVGVWEPVTVYAEDEGNPFEVIYIDEDGNLNPSGEETGGNDNDNDKYFIITGSASDMKYKVVTPEEGETVPETYNFHYDSSNHKLTLKNLNVSISEGSIIASDYDKNNENNKLTIELIGSNTVQTASGEAICLNGNTTVTGSGSLTAVTTSTQLTDENGDPYYPAAIQIGESCKCFENHATITAAADNAVSNKSPSFSAWHLTYGNMNPSSIADEDKPKGRIINRGTITGIIGLWDGRMNGLVSCDTSYGKPTDHNYIGKAYYFTKEEIYPNNVVGTLPEDTWRVVGKYDSNGEPKPSKVWYQWIYKDAAGTVYTEDRVNPIQFLVYPEDVKDGNIDKLLTKNDVAAVDDGTHEFGSLYAVWLTDGSVTVNGDVTLDVSCSSAPQEEDRTADDIDHELGDVDSWMAQHGITGDIGSYHKDGAVCYKKVNGEIQYHSSAAANITVTGNVGYLSLSDTYQGSVTIDGNINGCSLVKEKEFLNKWIYRLQWQFDNSTHHPTDVPYGAIPKLKAGSVVAGGNFTDNVEQYAQDESVEMVGTSLYDGTCFMQTETTKGEGDSSEEVAGTSAIVNDNSLLVNVSKENGLQTDTYPLVRKANATAEQDIQSHLSNRANMVAMDIAVIKQTKNEKNEVTAQKETEPTGTVNLYFDKLDLSGLSNPALFHIKDNGAVEKLAITTSGGVSTSVKCQTNSFSTYVFAEDQTIINPTPTIPSGGGSYGGGGASSGGTTDKPTTETKPDGTKVETSTETKADGTKVDTTVETKTDGTKTETVVETAKDGSVKTTETVTNADGSATKTEKETETNAQGKEVAVTTTTEKDVNGNVTGITQTSEIDQIAGSTSATVTVEKTADGKITSAEAEVDKKGANSKQGVKATLFGSVVSQITEAAGTQSVEISMNVTAGKKEYTVKADAQDLEAGNKLKVMAVDEKTGEYVLVNAKTYKVSESGNVKLTLPTGMTYQLMDSKEAATVEKQILATVKVKKSAATISEGKKTALKLSSKLNMDNVEKITYSSARKSVATVSKNGTITAKSSGSVVITAEVTLKNGKTKTVKMKIKVK